MNEFIVITELTGYMRKDNLKTKDVDPLSKIHFNVKETLNNFFHIMHLHGNNC